MTTAGPTRAVAAVRVLGAALGGLAVAGAASLCLARLPLPAPGLGFALGVALFVPLWVALACLGLVARRARHVWLACAGAATIFAWLTWLFG